MNEYTNSPDGDDYRLKLSHAMSLIKKAGGKSDELRDYVLAQEGMPRYDSWLNVVIMMVVIAEGTLGDLEKRMIKLPSSGDPNFDFRSKELLREFFGKVTGNDPYANEDFPPYLPQDVV